MSARIKEVSTLENITGRNICRLPHCSRKWQARCHAKRPNTWTNTYSLTAVAKAALRRKKAFEHQLEQTSAQMMTVEREIGSIESANINKETLDAMKNASNAIKQIHGGLTVDQVDQTMEDLREQHAVGEEIAEALTQGAGTTGVDEDELDEELAELQQEQLDERMLKTGSVPVSDQIQRMPSAPSKFLELTFLRLWDGLLTKFCSKEHCIGRGRRRGGRAAETAGRDGHVSEGICWIVCLGGVYISGSARILYTLLAFPHSGGAVLPQFPARWNRLSYFSRSRIHFSYGLLYSLSQNSFLHEFFNITKMMLMLHFKHLTHT